MRFLALALLPALLFAAEGDYKLEQHKVQLSMTDPDLSRLLATASLDKDFSAIESLQVVQLFLYDGYFSVVGRSISDNKAVLQALVYSVSGSGDETTLKHQKTVTFESHSDGLSIDSDITISFPVPQNPSTTIVALLSDGSKSWLASVDMNDKDADNFTICSLGEVSVKQFGAIGAQIRFLTESSVGICENGTPKFIDFVSVSPVPAAFSFGNDTNMIDAFGYEDATISAVRCDVGGASCTSSTYNINSGALRTQLEKYMESTDKAGDSLDPSSTMGYGLHVAKMAEFVPMNGINDGVAATFMSDGSLVVILQTQTKNNFPLPPFDTLLLVRYSSSEDTGRLVIAPLKGKDLPDTCSLRKGFFCHFSTLYAIGGYSLNELRADTDADSFMKLLAGRKQRATMYRRFTVDPKGKPTDTEAIQLAVPLIRSSIMGDIIDGIMLSISLLVSDVAESTESEPIPLLAIESDDEGFAPAYFAGVGESSAQMQRTLSHLSILSADGRLPVAHTCGSDYLQCAHLWATGRVTIQTSDLHKPRRIGVTVGISIAFVVIVLIVLYILLITCATRLEVFRRIPGIGCVFVCSQNCEQRREEKKAKKAAQKALEESQAQRETQPEPVIAIGPPQSYQ